MIRLHRFLSFVRRHGWRKAGPRLKLMSVAMVLLAGWVAGGSAAAGEPAAPTEHAIKAAFLYNFTKFIDWPGAAFASDDGPFVIAVLGRPALAQVLESAVQGRKCAGRAVAVRVCRTAADAAAAQMIFVDADDGTLRELMQRTAARPVVTVGNSERFLRQGGMIAFVVGADDKVRFTINMAVADRAGVRVSAQLQKLAKAIVRED